MSDKQKPIRDPFTLLSPAIDKSATKKLSAFLVKLTNSLAVAETISATSNDVHVLENIGPIIAELRMQIQIVKGLVK